MLDLTPTRRAAIDRRLRDDGEEVIVFEGNVELTSETTMEVMTEKYIEKYARLFPRTGSTPDQMKVKYTQPLRFTPAKIIAWGIPE